MFCFIHVNESNFVLNLFSLFLFILYYSGNIEYKLDFYYVLAIIKFMV